MPDHSARLVALTLTYVLVFFGLWAIAVSVLAIPGYLVPSPGRVLHSLYELPSYYGLHFVYTLAEAVFGLLFGVAAGALTAILMHANRRIAQALNPLLVASQAFPREALAPLLVIAFGFGIPSKVLVSALVCYFPIAINALRGLDALPQNQLELLKVHGATPWQVFVWGNLPWAMPYFLAALRVATVMAVVGAVVGEFVGGGGSGLGHVMLSARSDYGTERVFAALLLLWLMSATLYLLATILENHILSRLGLSRASA
jgi:NitT/TauT family transport system permease protein